MIVRDAVLTLTEFLDRRMRMCKQRVLQISLFEVDHVRVCGAKKCSQHDRQPVDDVIFPRISHCSCDFEHERCGSDRRRHAVTL